MHDILCPNCHTRIPDTTIEYDELVASRYSRVSMGYGGNRRSFASLSQRGKETLCAVCAARFHRMARMRTLGAAIGNRGFIALAVTIFLFLFLSGFVPAVHQGVGLYLALTPLALASVAVLLGGALALTSRLLRPSATRFLRKRDGTNG